MDDRPALLWKLRRENDEVSCQARLAPYGIEVDILHGGSVVLTRVFATDDEALGWARDKRVVRESQGWIPAPAETEPSSTRPA